MSRLHFMLKYGTLDHAKKAVAGANKNLLGYSTAMTNLLGRMRRENDPDFESMRDAHMKEMASHRIKAQWVVDSKLIQPEHLKMIATNFPHMLDRVAKNPNADADTLRLVHSLASNPDIADFHALRGIASHPNTPEDVLHRLKDYKGDTAAQIIAHNRLARTS